EQARHLLGREAGGDGEGVGGVRAFVVAVIPAVVLREDGGGRGQHQHHHECHPERSEGSTSEVPVARWGHRLTEARSFADAQDDRRREEAVHGHSAGWVGGVGVWPSWPAPAMAPTAAARRASESMRNWAPVTTRAPASTPWRICTRPSASSPRTTGTGRKRPPPASTASTSSVPVL